MLVTTADPFDDRLHDEMMFHEAEKRIG